MFHCNPDSHFKHGLLHLDFSRGSVNIRHCFRLYSGAESRAAVRGIKLPTISLLHTALHDQCPLRGDQLVACPDSSGRYRTADGRCNNPAHSWWGASMMPLHRFLPSHYKDGMYETECLLTKGPSEWNKTHNKYCERNIGRGIVNLSLST
jgi:hypothetical protein